MKRLIRVLVRGMYHIFMSGLLCNRVGGGGGGWAGLHSALVVHLTADPRSPAQPHNFHGDGS